MDRREKIIDTACQRRNEEIPVFRDSDFNFNFGRVCVGVCVFV